MASASTQKNLDLNLLWRILNYLKPYKLAATLSVVCIIVLALISPVRPWLIQHTIDKAIITNNHYLLSMLCLAMVGVLLFETLIQFADSYLSTWLGQSVIKDIRIQVYQSITKFKASYFDANSVGTLVTRTVSDTEAIADIFSQGLLTIVGDILKLTTILIAMFITDWKLSLVSISTIPVLFVATVWFKNAVRKSFADVRTQVARLNSFVQERINGIRLIQAFNQEEEQLELFKTINNEHTKANIRSIWHYSVFFPIVEILSSMSLGLLIWYGAGQVLDYHIQPGHLVSFILYINMLFRPIRMLADRFNTLQMGMVASERVFKVIDQTDQHQISGNINKKLNGNIEFKNISFYYHQNHWVLKNLSLQIKAGEKIALVGATGSGKTTITSLINRFYDIQEGEILLDNQLINQYSTNSLREQIGVVLQDVFLFSDTIFNNIVLGNSNIKKEDVINASIKIGTHDFITQLPGKYEFNVLERGNTLSAGQRQLLSILRVYVHNPSILILDEATANIDSESEKLIQHAINELTKNRTSIVVAHRLSTVKNADRIIVLEKGKIIESGSHTALLNHKGHYFKLLEKHKQNNELIV